VSIEKVWEEARKINPQIGYATVYRTLILLVEARLAQQRHFSSGQSLFELAGDEHHDHLICTECGKIFEFENDTIESLQERIAKKFAFRLTSHKMELYGICAACQKK
jgi:Fur family ferric uptake transcriptional regulator